MNPVHFSPFASLWTGWERAMTQAEGEFDPRSVHEGFMQDELALGEVFLHLYISTLTPFTYHEAAYP
jgi:hypothetical protein